jgi:very-short-patch-repair endonuclease
LRKRDTWAEHRLWRWLRNRRFSQYKFRRQHPFGPYILDFFCAEAQLNIELDGGGHGHPDQKEQDAARDAYLEARGIRVLRIWNRRLRRQRAEVRETLFRLLMERAPHPMPHYWQPGVAGGVTPNATGAAEGQVAESDAEKS